ncbi:SusC/RagA family TonB-linked outer membrane protein [Niastella sp. OAS944]|uniref:SusC/RagA family TonB-linked outer membrane protein n=1 Tax=Niastella sp. OAS944 TaxID=2664089 RepID=UPI00348EC500|nr:TonB-linked SusC/RagA family outer membrane protein [Chitinophagaceae bacterium OAS944]
MLTGNNIINRCAGIAVLTASLLAAGAAHAQQAAPDTTGIALKDSTVKTVASYDVIYNRELIKSPVVDITNALSGRLTGLYTLQQAATPGNDGASVFVRGISNPLIVIDGIPRDYTLLNPAEIESVTVLKDALAVNLYGMRGSNGVLLINTRKGTPGKQTISFTAQYGVQQPTVKPKYLNAYDYATLFNEALANDKKQPAYLPVDLDAYKNGTDPYGHPNVDWWSTVLRNKMRFARYSADVSGGGQFAQYYLALDHVNQQGIFVKDAKNSYNTNNDYKQYSIRSNVTMNINPSLKAFLNVFALIRNGTQPGYGSAAIFNTLYTTPNNAYPVYNSDGSYGGTVERNANLRAQVVNSGYWLNYNRNLYADVGLQQSLDVLAKGLWISGKASFGSDLTEDIDRTKTFATFKMNVDPATGAVTYTKFGTDGTQNNGGNIATQTRNSYWELTAGYNKIFNNAHTITVRAVAASQQYGNDNLLPLRYNTYSAYGAYNFRNRYHVEVSATGNKQNRYVKGNDFGIFPAAGIGWTVSNENWFPQVKQLSTLRLKASYGRTGLDNIGYYVYGQFYGGSSNTGYTLGVTPTTISGVTESTLANTNITWEKADKMNAGIELGLFKNKLRATAEYYKDNYFDLMQVRGRSIALIGNTYPQENIGRNRYYGWEFSLQFEDKIGAVKYFAGLKLSTRQSKVMFADEVDRKYDYMRRTGEKVGQIFGYVADGFYTREDSIAKAPVMEGYHPVFGDLKYKDLNGDSIINRYDVTAIGNKKAMIYGGLQAGIEWKGIGFSFLLQGTANRDITLSASDWEFQSLENGGYGQAQQHHLGRWTEATAATATYPRLTVGTNANNQTTSSFWVRSGNYLRLKNIELSYNLPAKWVNAAKMNEVRFFITGFNLITFSDIDRLDPEYPYVNGYPNLKMINGGLNIKF